MRAPAPTEEEFAALYRATATDLFAYVRRRYAGDAEDVVAETYAVAWRRRGSMPAPVHRRAWLFGVARVLLAAQQRRDHGDSALASELARQPDAVAAAPPSAGRLGAITDAVERLPAAEREALRLAMWEGLTAGEVAVALGIRPGTARVRLHRARRTLARDPEVRALIEGPDPGPLARVSATGAG